MVLVLDHQGMELLDTQLNNWTGQPATSLPLAPPTSGRPIGIQLAAARMRDDVLRLSYDLEEALPWADRRPAVCASGDAA